MSRIQRAAILAFRPQSTPCAWADQEYTSAAFQAKNDKARSRSSFSPGDFGAMAGSVT